MIVDQKDPQTAGRIGFGGMHLEGSAAGDIRAATGTNVVNGRNAGENPKCYGQVPVWKPYCSQFQPLDGDVWRITVESRGQNLVGRDSVCSRNVTPEFLGVKRAHTKTPSCLVAI